MVVSASNKYFSKPPAERSAHQASVRTFGSRSKNRLPAALTNFLSSPVTPSSRATPAFCSSGSASGVQPMAFK